MIFDVNRTSLRYATGAWIMLFLWQAAADPLQRRKKKDEEPETQVLEALPDPPATISVDATRLAFVTAPLSAKGLLSQQVKDGMRYLLSAARGNQIVKVRAFVSGTGDLRRVPDIVAEAVVGKKLPMPVMSVIQVGGLPLEGAQVELEAAILEKRIVNPGGLAFLSGQYVESKDPSAKAASLASESLARLRRAADAVGSQEVLRVTCMLTSLEDHPAVRSAAMQSFPAAQLTLLQTQRAPALGIAECEAISRLREAPADRLRFVNPEGLPSSPNYSQAALVGPGNLVLASTQLAFRYSEADAKLAFQRLERNLQAGNTSLRRAVMINTYSLSQQITELIRKVRVEFLDAKNPPASTLLTFEGLPSMDAAFGLEVVALAP
jgi:enamine deaminase RidA (YjgF/YER057c/UK114 family)